MKLGQAFSEVMKKFYPCSILLMSILLKVVVIVIKSA